VDVTPLIIVLFGGGGAAALIVAIRETLKWLRSLKTDEIELAIQQWKTVSNDIVAQLRERNDELQVLNDRQEQQITELRAENDRLEILTRSLSQQNMDIGHQAEMTGRELKKLMEEHHQLLGRIREREGGTDAA
jgi:small-conductance mechanosensitive channel